MWEEAVGEGPAGYCLCPWAVAQGVLVCLPGLSLMTLESEDFLSQSQILNLLKGPGGSAHLVGLAGSLKDVWKAQAWLGK